MTEIPFCGEFYTDRSGNANAQECINFYPFKSPTPQNKDRIILYPTPGFINLFDETIPNIFADEVFNGNSSYNMLGTEVRGDININDVIYAVVGNRFISFTTSPAPGSIGSPNPIGTLNSSSGRVRMLTNTVDILIVDDMNGYVYNLGTKVFTQVDNSGSFPTGGVTNIAFQDDYYIAMVKGSRQVIVSGLLDGTSWPALATDTVTTFADDGVGVYSDQNQLYIFGRQVAEVQFDAGTIPYPFEKVSGVLIQAGCLAIDTVVKVGATTMWLANDVGESPFVAMLLGYSVIPISNPALNEAMSRYSVISDAWAYTYREGDDQFYMLTFPSAGATWGYSLKGKMWHKRVYTKGADLPTCCTYINNQRGSTSSLINHLVGDMDGNMWVMSQDWSQLGYNQFAQSGNGVFPKYWPPVRTRVSPHFNQGGKNIFLNWIEIDYQAGVGVNNTTAEDMSSDKFDMANPRATMFVSKDEGNTWINVGTRELGGAGKYRKRMIWRNLGWSWSWTFKLVISDPVATYIMGLSGSFKTGK